MMFTKRGLILCLGIVGFLSGGGIGIAVATLLYWSSFSISVAARAAVIGGLAFCGSWGVVGLGSFSLLDRDSPEQTTNVMLGVKHDNRESVHDLMKVVLTPNIGLD
jgi:hypothetical protein